MSKRLITNFSELPTPEEDPEFYTFITHPEYKRVVHLMLIAEARSSDPSSLSDSECRTRLAKIYAMNQLLDMPAMIKTYIESPQQEPQESHEVDFSE